MRLPDGQTLLGKTYRRAAGLLAGHGEIVTVTNREHYFQSKDQFQAARRGGTGDISSSNRPGATPLRRLPSPPLALQAEHGDAAVLVVMPADHLIRNERPSARRWGMPRVSRRRAPGYLRRGAGRSGNRFRLYRAGRPAGRAGAAKVRRFVETR